MVTQGDKRILSSMIKMGRRGRVMTYKIAFVWSYGYGMNQKGLYILLCSVKKYACFLDCCLICHREEISFNTFDVKWRTS